MPRFVILEHDHPFVHWDFMLEAAGSLRTWRLAAPPAADEVIAASPLGNHRLAYLEYEGPVSGGRGVVTRWDSGEYQELEQSDQRLQVSLHGRRLQGTATLVCGSGQDWTWRWAPQVTLEGLT